MNPGCDDTRWCRPRRYANEGFFHSRSGEASMTRSRKVFVAVGLAIATSMLFLIAREVVEKYPSESEYVLENGQLVGGDFLAFYVAGQLFSEHRSRLYDLEFQREFRREVLGPSTDAEFGELPFVYPPLVAGLMAPLSRLPFQRAFAVWALFGFVASMVSLIFLCRRSGASALVPTPLILVLSVAYIPYSIDTLIGGQIAWMGIAILALVATALLAGRDVLAGLVMSVSYYKPPLFLFLLVVLCLARGRRFIGGFLGGALLLLGISAILVGPAGLLEYVQTVSTYAYGRDVLPDIELPPGEGMGLVGLLVTWLPSLEVALIALSVPFLAVAYLSWRGLTAPSRSRTIFGLALCTTATVAFSLQCIKYDLALLLVPMILGLGWLARREASLVRLAIVAPFLGFFFEFAFRHLAVAGKVVNASSVLFVLLLASLSSYAWTKVGRPDRKLVPNIR